MSKIKLELRRYRVPVKRTDEVMEEGNTISSVDYQEVELNDYYVDSEDIEIDDIEGLTAEGTKVNSYNSRQLNFARNDSTILTVYKKVVCKPKAKQN